MNKYHTWVSGHDGIETQFSAPNQCDVVGCNEESLLKFKIMPTVNGKSLGKMIIKACRKHSAEMIAQNYEVDNE